MRDTDKGYRRTMEAARALQGSGAVVVVGLVEGEGGDEMLDSGGLTLAALGAVHEFGTTIDHPGGTPYQVVGGRARFVRKDSPEGVEAIAAGRVTGPHKIEIPERAPIRKTLDEQAARIGQAATVAGSQLAAGADPRTALTPLGLFVASQIQRTIQMGVEPPNAASTIRQKESSKPLVDTGFLRDSYTYQVREG